MNSLTTSNANQVALLFFTCNIITLSSTFQENNQGLESKDSKILLVSGSTKSGLSKNVKIVDLKNPHNKCKVKSSVFEAFGATGGLLNGELPIICGGIKGKSSCQAISNSNTSLKLTEERSFTASISLENDSQLWITGGYNGDTPSNTIEIVKEMYYP